MSFEKYIYQYILFYLLQEVDLQLPGKTKNQINSCNWYITLEVIFQKTGSQYEQTTTTRSIKSIKRNSFATIMYSEISHTDVRKTQYQTQVTDLQQKLNKQPPCVLTNTSKITTLIVCLREYQTYRWLLLTAFIPHNTTVSPSFTMAEPSEVSIESKINQVYIILNYFFSFYKSG